MCLAECVYSSDRGGELAAVMNTLIGAAKLKDVDTRSADVGSPRVTKVSSTKRSPRT